MTSSARAAKGRPSLSSTQWSSWAGVARAGDDPPVQAFRIIRAGQVHHLVDLGIAVEELQKLAVAALPDDGVDILEDANDRPFRLHFTQASQRLLEPGRRWPTATMRATIWWISVDLPQPCFP